MMGTEKTAQIICHLLELLKDNRRLPAPCGCPGEVRALPGAGGDSGGEHCAPPDGTIPCVPPQVYTLMLSCWAFSPSARPTFGELVTRIEVLRDGRSKACG